MRAPLAGGEDRCSWLFVCAPPEADPDPAREAVSLGVPPRKHRWGVGA